MFMFLFSLGVRGNFCVFHFPNLLVGNVYLVEKEGYLLEVFLMRFLTKLCLYMDLSNKKGSSSSKDHGVFEPAPVTLPLDSKFF